MDLGPSAGLGEVLLLARGRRKGLLNCSLSWRKREITVPTRRGKRESESGAVVGVMRKKRGPFPSRRQRE